MKKHEKARDGQKIVTETAPDRSSHKMDKDMALCGKKMGGGPRDVSHSLKGSSTVDYMSKGSK